MPRKLSLLVPAACLLAAASIFGYALEGQKWPQGADVTMQLSAGSSQTLIDGSAGFNGSAEDALAQWNAVLNRFQFSVVRNSTAPQSGGDSNNSVFFASKAFGEPFDQYTLAVTIRRYVEGSSTLTEADVIFNSARSWNSYRGPLRDSASGSSLDDFHRVAIHEFGHVLGLDHPDEAGQNVNAIMNAYVSNIDALQADDIKGGQYLYGGPAPTATPTPAPTSADNLVNLSTRGLVGTGDDVLIGGFIVQGVQQSSMALRALGPSLSARGIANPIGDPVLELHDASGTLVRSNDDWQESANAAALSSKGLAPTSPQESALIAQLDGGSYTVVVRGANGGTGVGLVELYDLQATNARAANISTRARVETGDRVMIAGFIVGGDQPKQVIVRALGPSLANVSGPLTDPVLEVRNSAGNLVAQNDDWQQSPDAGTIQSKGIAPKNERESAILTTLSPGSYTAIVRGYNNESGVGLAEVYDLSPAPNQ